ncbi:MAG: tryptophan 7-halogenase [Gammaproteobacteria bacterium]|nr:tryptophan 7-halogenase [Gammaproteobacteria bacterium]
MMANRMDDILIVGGGTAGWLTAAILAKQLHAKSADGVNITLVESPTIPILGVGEGTWPNLRATLQKIGVDEGEFMRECDATFKQGAEFVNWAHTPQPDERDSYYHPLNTVFHSSYDFNLSAYWLMGQAPSDLPYDLAVASQARICNLGLAPKKITTPAYAALQEYSYHLNANKFAAFLTKHCVEKLGVKHLKANVIDVNLTDDGFIESVNTDVASLPQIKADFFIDSSGNNAVLIEKALGIDWHDIDDIIFNDTALAMQVPYPTPDHPISTHTIATAQPAGWIWDIGLHNRRGVGHVYSSKHMDDEQAEELLRQYIGPESDGITARKIKLRLGYRNKFWHKNCVAIGMSASFVEPLEASAIYLFDAAANMIADQFPRSRAALPHVERKFNQSFKMRMERTIDFIKLHYCVSQRRDTQYWRDNCDPKSIPDSLQWRLNHWQTHPPTKYDFDNAWEPFNLDSYLYVLYGMRYQTDLSGNHSAFAQGARAQKMFAEVDRITDVLSKILPQQRELIEKVYQHGFSKV